MTGASDTYQTIADLLADPALGKLEALREYARWKATHPHVGFRKADAAILAVANEFAEFKTHHYGGGCGCDAALPYEREGS